MAAIGKSQDSGIAEEHACLAAQVHVLEKSEIEVLLQLKLDLADSAAATRLYESLAIKLDICPDMDGGRLRRKVAHYFCWRSTSDTSGHR